MTEADLDDVCKLIEKGILQMNKERLEKASVASQASSAQVTK